MKHVQLSQIPFASVSHNAAIKKQVMLNPDDVANLIYFSQARFKPGHIAPGHAHADMSEIFFVETGEGLIIVDGNPYSLSPGTCVAVLPGEVHEVSNTGTTDLVLTYFGVKTTIE